MVQPSQPESPQGFWPVQGAASWLGSRSLLLSACSGALKDKALRGEVRTLDGVTRVALEGLASAESSSALAVASSSLAVPSPPSEPPSLAAEDLGVLLVCLWTEKRGSSDQPLLCSTSAAEEAPPDELAAAREATGRKKSSLTANSQTNGSRGSLSRACSSYKSMAASRAS